MAEDEDAASPVLALRAAFGDRKPPEISRKITACVACRKQKIKCHMNDGQAPCTRCKKRGLPCTVNRSLQMLLESDTSWKHAMEKKMRRLEAIVSMMAKDRMSPGAIERVEEQAVENDDDNDRNQQDENDGDIRNSVGHVEQDTQRHDSDPDRRNGDQGTNHWEIVMDLDSGPGAMPGFYISDTPPSQAEAGQNGTETTGPNIRRRDQHVLNGSGLTAGQNKSRSVDHSSRDFISRGLVRLEHAQAYFDNYHNRMDHFPYRILCDHGPVSLSSLRVTSPLLVVAVCSVGALHTFDRAGGATDFNRLHAEFVSLCSHKAMSKACTMDDVRALCIGAFWLGGDLSWSLVGAAVRMATELQLHRSFHRALDSEGSGSESRTHYLRTRLWYLVYVCDHHFSVVYGRPPLTREDESVREARRFVDGPHATEDDARLVSQVLRWSLCTNIFDTFGVDVTRPLKDTEVPHLRRFGLALDGLRAEWVDRFRPNPHVGNYPRKGVQLQYNFAKLYLYSHAFRGMPENGQRKPGIDTLAGPPTATPTAAASTISSFSHADATIDLDEAANAGVLAALSILRAVVSDPEIQSYLDGLPVYFDVMIAFAAVFLLKVASKFSASVLINAQEITSLVVSLVATLRRVTQTMHPSHLLVSITKGIENLLQRSGLTPGHESGETALDRESGPDSIVVQTELTPGQNNEVVAQAAHENELHNGGHTQPDLFAADQAWAANSQPDPYFMGEYDFLMNQDMDFDMQFSVDL